MKLNRKWINEEFVDLSHTPKNLLIRAVKTNVSEKKKQQAMNEIQNLIKEFSVRPTLYALLYGEKRISDRLYTVGDPFLDRVYRLVHGSFRK